jgi:hypothetical protein
MDAKEVLAVIDAHAAGIALFVKHRPHNARDAAEAKLGLAEFQEARDAVAAAYERLAALEREMSMARARAERAGGKP